MPWGSMVSLGQSRLFGWFTWALNAILNFSVICGVAIMVLQFYPEFSQPGIIHILLVISIWDVCPLISVWVEIVANSREIVQS